MDEGAIVTNVATILAKDLLLDRSPKFRPLPYPLQQFRNFLEDDEESLDHFVYNMLRKRKQPNFGNDMNIKRSKRDIRTNEDSSSMSETVMMSAVPSIRLNNSIAELEVNLRIPQFLPPRDFECNLHMRKGTFNALLEVLAPLIKESIRRIDNSLISKDTFISLALWKLTTSQHFEEISRRFKIPVSVCYKSTSNFCDLLSNFIKTFINWPNRQQIAAIRTHKETQMIGVIGAKILDVFLESEDDEVSVVLQIVCTSDLIITDCHLELATEYRSSESPILNKLRSQSDALPFGYYLFGDSCFPLSSFLITPFSETQDRKQINFNRYIDDKMKIVNDTMKQMMSRFQTLYSLEARNLNEMKKTVETICGLHNFCRRFNDNCIPKLPDSTIGNRKVQIKGSETDPNGIRRRDELMTAISLH